MHNSGISILLFVVLSLLVGAILKALMRNSLIPYTVILLLVGIVAGGMNQLGLFGTHTLVNGIFTQVGHIDPHLILYLFLPTLIFESAYSMEPHLFFRIAPQIALLAIIGLIISMVLSALALEKSFKVPKPPKWMQKVPIMGHSMEGWLFSRLSLSYDIARGFVSAQEEMRQHIAALQPDEKAGEYIDAMIDKNCSQAIAFTRHMNNEYPELISQVQSKSARRLLLNHERSLIWEMKHDGVLETAEAQHMIDNIESQMLKMRREHID